MYSQAVDVYKEFGISDMDVAYIFGGPEQTEIEANNLPDEFMSDEELREEGYNELDIEMIRKGLKVDARWEEPDLRYPNSEDHQLKRKLSYNEAHCDDPGDIEF